jgi:SAM-dependent methyltransferase
MTSSTAPLTHGAYERLAGEYYDAERHPTCANFREASRQLIDRLLPSPPLGRICETGAGDSLLAPLLADRGWDLGGLLLTDASPAMLAHSEGWANAGAQLSVAEAESLPVPSSSLDLVVASLGDPYDDDGLWAEVSRTLRDGGRCVFTTPSWQWAMAFRADARGFDLAEFTLADGTVLSVPSRIRPSAEERLLIERHGLRILGEAEAPRRALTSSLSPKLAMLRPDDPVVVGYLVGAGADA